MPIGASNLSLQELPPSLESDPTAHPGPPATSLHQELPFGELTWENFERLCLRLARTSSDVERCRLYGTRGQSQEGIDLYARRTPAEKYTVYQCKREKDFGPTKIATAVAVFLNGNWVERAERFVLCTKEDLRTAQRTEEIERQTTTLKRKSVDFLVWDASELNILLKNEPLIIDDFFGRAWVEAFCGETGLGLVRKRLDGPRATAVRNDLKKLYTVTFKADDPGLPVSLMDSRYLPLEERYVVPDVVVARSPSQGVSRPSEQVSEATQQELAGPSSDDQSSSDAERSPKPNRERRSRLRQSVDEWLKDKRNAVILAGPGSGKSTLLRFVALDLLSASSRFTALSSVHNNRLPVWVPFGFWTALVATDSTAEHSIEDVVWRWLHHLASDNLWPSVKAAMDDQRLLLLVDGLDEYRSDAAAGTALRQLQIFVELRNCPAILTSRPLGYQRLPALTGDWQTAHLAEFTPEQQRQFVSIWTRFRLSNDGNNSTEAELDPRVSAEVERFETDLQRNSALRELAGTPLLLGILLYLSFSNLPLPQNRFQAYRRMIDHLIAEHPKARQRAASLTATVGLDFLADDFRKILAALAFRLFTSHPEGTIEQSDALVAVREFLSDTEIGFGHDFSTARKAAERVIAEGETSLGVLVERAPGLYAFLHRAFLEHLCATHITSLPFDEQLRRIEEHCAEPQWREVILGVSYLTARSNDVRQIVARLRQKSTVSMTPFLIETILCEIGVGVPACPSDVCLELCIRSIKEIETGSWMPHRVTLLRLLLSGIHSPKVQRLIRSRLSDWYPCRSFWRRDLYSFLAENGLDEPVREVLFRGLLDEQSYIQGAAADAIANLATREPHLADTLLAMLARPNSVAVIAAVSETLLRGWLDHPVWNDLEDRLRHSASIELRQIGIWRRIRANRHDERDKSELLWMASRDATLGVRGSSTVTAAIIEGWPGDLEIRDEAIACANRRVYAPDALYPGAAVRILIDGYSNDPIATSALCELIRNEEHAFPDSHHTWKLISEKYVGNPGMIAAADDWLERRSAHHYPEVSFASRLGWTSTAKRILLKNLDVWVPFWAAEALLDGWGMDDPEVAQAITALSNSEKGAEIGHLFPRIILDRHSCFTKLVGMLESPDCRDPARVLAGICEVMTPDDRERVLEAGLKWIKQQILSHRERVVELLFRSFSDDARALSLARRELKRRDGNWTAVVKAYGHLQEIRSEAIKMASPLPSELRSEIVDVLEANAASDQEAFELLSLFDLEYEPSLKTKGTIAYCRALKRSGRPAQETVDYLAKALTSGGPDYESRRQSAVCGLDLLGRLDVLDSVRRDAADRLPIGVSSGMGSNDIFVQYLLSNWLRVQSSLGGSFEETFFRGGMAHDLSWWSQVAPFADGYPAVRDTLLSIIEGVQNQQLYSELLLFLGRNRPRSALLRDHCRQIIKGDGLPSGRWIEVDTASFLLGRDFHEDQDLISELTASDAARYGRFDNVQWALCELSPSAEIVGAAFNEMKEGNAEKDVISVQGITEMHLLCICGTANEVFDGLMDFVSRLHGDLIYHAAAFLRPVLRRVKDDVELQSMLRDVLSRPRSISELCSAAHILYRAVGPDELRLWCLEKAIQKDDGSPLYSPVGFDLTTGIVATRWEVGMHILNDTVNP
jgi:hypothetical protein